MRRVQGIREYMKFADPNKGLINETAVAAGLALSGMQPDSRCITAGSWSPVPVTEMVPTRFKGT